MWFWLAMIVASQIVAWLLIRVQMPKPYTFPQCRPGGCHLFTDGVEHCMACGVNKPPPQLPEAKIVRRREHRDFLGYDEDGP